MLIQLFRKSVKVALSILLFAFTTQVAVAATVSVGFEDGFVGEYSNNAHQPVSIKTFATLGIDSVTISQNSNNTSFGGTQGNDYAVTLTVLFLNGTKRTFPAAVNWRDGNTDGIGVTVGASVVDGTTYSVRNGFNKTYLLRLVGSTKVYADTAVGSQSGVVSGNAATGNALDALNTYLAALPRSTEPSALTSTITAAAPSILANGTSTSLITVQLKDVNGNNLTAGGGVVTLSTTAGTLSNVVNNNNGTYSATLTSSTSVVSATITGTVGGFGIADDATVSFTSSSSISGKVLDSRGAGLSGRPVNLLNSSAQTVSTTLSATGGIYSFSNIAPGTYSIAFENTGSFKAKGKSATGSPNGSKVESLTVLANTTVTNVDAIVIDPAGVVYNSVTRQPVAGAVVRFLYNNALVPNEWLDQNLGGSNTQTTGSDGQYSFVLNSSASNGVYSLDVSTPAGFGFQSAAIAPTAGPYVPTLGGSLVAIQPQATAPSGSDSTTYYLNFNFTIGTTSATTSNGVINNHIPIDPLAVSISNTANAAEPSTNGALAVRLNVASATNVVASYSVGGTATAGSDYSALTGSVTITAGQLTAAIPVNAIDDSLVEGAETVIVTLTGVTSGNASLSPTASALTATNTITDDDAAVASIANTTDSAEPSTNGVLTVNLSTAASTDVVLTYSIAGTATSGTDYTARSGTVTIVTGQTSATITVPVLPDSIAEGNETVIVTLTGVTSGTASLSATPSALTATNTITDDDTAVVSIANTTDSAEPSTNGVLTVNLSNASSTNTVIAYSVTGTATSGTDYTSRSGTVTVAAGQTSATISVPVLTDSIAEGNETVIVTLTGVTSGNASLSATPTALTATNTIVDDDIAYVTIVNTTNGAEPSTNGDLTVSLSNASSTNTVLAYSVAGTATSGTDYTALSGTVTVAAGQTSATISLPVLDDSIVESSETVVVTLASVTSGTASLSGTPSALTATNTITDNDTAVNNAPTFTNKNAGSGTSYSFDYAEKLASASVVGTVSATDPENSALTYSITGGNGSNWFAISSSSGAITLTSAGAASLANDFEVAPNTHTLTVSVSDGSNVIAVQVALNETYVDDNPPAISGPTGQPGAPNDAAAVNEAQTAVMRLSASEVVTWTISGGNDRDKFQIAADGTITFVATPDYETPLDADTNNTYILTVTATDAAGNISTQTITVTVLNIDDTAPVILGPSGGPGAVASAVSVSEAQTAVTRLSASEVVTWTISGGNDRDKFQMAADGTTTFLSAPDFESPADSDTNNTYVLTVTATDAAGNMSTQTITVTILDVDDTAPAITGPSGGAGAAASALTMTEGLTVATRFTANEPVTWSIDSGADAAKFRIDAATGAIVFIGAPDFENPTDSDRNNTYVVRIKAVDTAGNISYQTLTVTISNVDEIVRKLAQIGDKLRGSLRNYAAHGLSDMLAFNESLMASNDDVCADPKTQKALSGSARANENGANLDVKYAQRLSECSRPHQLFVDSGLSSSRMGGNWNSRIFGALRFETKFNDDITLGLAALVSRSSDELNGFDTSSISDKSLQVNAYGRYRISDTLRAGAFIGFGQTSYDFVLTESDGFDLNGSMTGKRQIYGWMLSGDFNLGDTEVTTDAVISHAREKIGSAILVARYLGENRSGLAFAVGTVDVTRISIPVTAPISLSGSPDYGSWSRLLLSPGLLCEDNDVQSSGLRCGYQLGAKFLVNDGARGRFYADYNWERVAGMRRSLIGVGFAYRIGEKNNLELAVEANRGVTVFTGQDNRAMLSIRLAR
jgi:hypothetical protein